MTKILILQCREYGFDAWSWTVIWSEKKITGFAVGWLSTSEKAWRRLGVCCLFLLYSWDVAKPGPLIFVILFVKFSSIAQSCLTLCDPMDCSTPGFPVHHQCPELAQTHAHRVSDAIQPSHPLSPHLLLPSIFPSIRVFSSESVLCIRWPKYWSFSFSISPFVKLGATISKLKVEL